MPDKNLYQVEYVVKIRVQALVLATDANDATEITKNDLHIITNEAAGRIRIYQTDEEPISVGLTPIPP